MKDYAAFLARKAQYGEESGFAPTWLPDFLFPFQRSLVEWAVKKGRAAIFADCGLGKTPMQLVWAENIVRHTNKPVLIATPLAVSHQTVREAEKFGIDCVRLVGGRPARRARVLVTNYERLHLFRPEDFAGLVCDESSILKRFEGARRAIVTEFMRTLPYRLLCTATAAPNDYTELGTSSEALGELGFMDMLTRFFSNRWNTIDLRRRWRAAGENALGWRLKEHARQPFWQWVCSWARAVRRPSDIGFDDGSFVLPPLSEIEHIVTARTPRPDLLFDLPAIGLREEREERRRTVPERCEQVAALVRHDEPALVWCHLNEEARTLVTMIPDAVEVSGSMADEEKEEKLLAFADGSIRVLVTKARIGAWGLNFQRCAHVTFFPSHSYEQYYQGVRRCWRFGQQRPVRVDIIATEGAREIMANFRRKARAADEMFQGLVAHMNAELRLVRSNDYTDTTEVPSWLRSKTSPSTTRSTAATAAR